MVGHWSMISVLKFPLQSNPNIVAIRTFLLLITALTYTFTIAQDQDKYAALVKEASQLYNSKQFTESARKYKEAFDVMEGKAIASDRYNAACSYALANSADSAFYHLFRLARDVKYANYNHLITDKDLVPLYKDKRWEVLTATVKLNKEVAEKYLDKPLVATLDSIYINDQGYRQQIDSFQKKYGWESKEMQGLFQQIHNADSVNQIKVRKILDERGWLGEDIVSKQGNQTLFLVIQHADLDVQLKYLPMMMEAAAKGKANRASLAMLEDRIAIRQGKRQLYGSQIGRDETTGKYYVLPLEDPDNVDKRRAEVGLGTLQHYVSMWQIIWNAEEYKKLLPSLEAKKKQ